MTYQSNPFAESLELTLQPNLYKDLPISSYKFLAEYKNEKGVWVYKRRQTSPEGYVQELMEDHGYTVLADEGKLIKELFGLFYRVSAEEISGSSFFTSPYDNETTEFFEKVTVEKTVTEFIWSLNSMSFDPLCPFYCLDEESLCILTEILESTGLDLLCQLQRIVAKDQLKLSGWPDLTLVKDGKLTFVEVKTTDRLTRQQKVWISRFVEPLNFNYIVIKIEPESGKAIS